MLTFRQWRMYISRTYEGYVQTLLDSLASRLKAAVILEDVEFRLLSHTSQSGQIDEVRRTSILGRRATPEVRSWFEQCGIREAREPVRTPANPALGALERWCVPVYHRGRHLGYIWILDNGDADAASLRYAAEVAAQLGEVLLKRRLLAQGDNDHLRMLLTPRSPTSQLESEALELASDAYAGTIAVVASATHDTEAYETLRSDHESAIFRTAEQAAVTGRLLGGMLSDVGVLLIPLRPDGELGPAVRLAETLRRLALRSNERLHLIAAIGPACDLRSLSGSYAKARRALRIMQAVPGYGPVATWDQMGIFQGLSLLALDQPEEEILDPRVRALLADQELALTAETYLELAGNAQATATRLFIHRTTLYQRLARIAAVHKLDLQADGEHRLIAHLGFKLILLRRGWNGH